MKVVTLLKPKTSMLLLLLLSRFSCVRLCVTPQTAAHQAPRPWDSPSKNTGVGCHFLLLKLAYLDLKEHSSWYICLKVLQTSESLTCDTDLVSAFINKNKGVIN